MTTSQGTVAIFGYGSLVNVVSLQQTIGRPPSAISYVNLQGWVRDWSVAVANDSLTGRYVHTLNAQLPEHILALNIQQNRLSPFGVNGVLFETSAAEIQRLDAREFCYERIDVTADILGDHPYDTIYTYAGLAKYLVAPGHTAVIPESYETVVAEGFRNIDELAYKWYQQSTIPSTHKIEPTQYVLGSPST